LVIIKNKLLKEATILNENLEKVLNIGGFSVYYILTRTIFYSVLGLGINLVFLFFLMPELTILWSGVSFGDLIATQNLSSAMTVLWELLWQNLQVIIVLLLFAIIMPWTYFMLGKKQGVKRALVHITRQSKNFIGLYLTNLFLDFVTTKIDWQSLLIGDNTKEKLDKLFIEYFKFLKTQPLAIRWVCNYFIKKVNFKDVITEIIANENLDSFNRDKIAAQALTKFRSYLVSHFFRISHRRLWLLLSWNIGMFYTLKIFI
jgi:hypothetical protein